MSDEIPNKTSRACEACRRRKVKCSGQVPCPPCVHHGLRCVISGQPRQASSRKDTHRGKRLLEFKSDGRRGNQRALLPTEHTASADAFEDDAITSVFVTLDEMVSAYNTSVFPTHPIISSEELVQCLGARNQDNVAAAVIYASAAATLNCTSDSSDQDVAETRGHLQRLTANAIRAFGPLTAFAPISVLRIMTCVFVANCMVAVNDSTTAFLYLRHAVSMVETFRLDSGRASNEPDWPRKQRLHWLLFIHERYQCISEYRSVVLQALPDLPADDPGLQVGVCKGFFRVVKLFKLVDAEFINHWLGKDEHKSVDAQWVTSKCDEFYADEIEAREDELHFTPSQRADLAITRHWLIMLLWRMAISHNVLSEVSLDAVPLHLPIEISRRLRRSIEGIPARDVEIHGIGVVQKLFELADTMADVVLHFPPADLEGLAEQLDDLDYLGRKVISSTRLDEVRKGILSEKFQRLRSKGMIVS